MRIALGGSRCAALDDRLLPVFAATALAGHPARRARRRRDDGRPRSIGSRPVAGCGSSAACSGSSGVAAHLARQAARSDPQQRAGRAPASHYAAAALHGIPGFGRGRPEISHPARPRAPAHRTCGSTPAPTSIAAASCTIDGIPATDIDRTILDLARTVGHERPAASDRVGSTRRARRLVERDRRRMPVTLGRVGPASCGCAR